MEKVLKWLGAFIFIAVIGIQSVSASSLNDELAMDTSNISIEQLDSRNSVPLNTPVVMQALNPAGAATIPLGTLTIGPWAGWNYPYLDASSSSSETFTIVPAGRGAALIRAEGDFGHHRYFNISRRGYVYLDTRENARQFTILEDLVRGGFVIRDMTTNSDLGLYRTGGFDYVTIGSGTRTTNWGFIALNR